MITFKLKFLLAFSPKTKDKPKKEKTKEKSGAKSKGITELLKDPPYVIRLEKTYSVAHVEYELVPGRCKYQIDILCWPNAAKIYTLDGVKLFKTITKNRLTFVPICIVHYLKELSTDDLESLQASVIEFNVFNDKNKIGSAAKSNKTEIMYLRPTDSDRTDFVEGFTEKVNESVTSTKKSIKTNKTYELEETLLHHGGYQKNEAYSQMNFEEDFAEELYEIIDLITSEDSSDDKIQLKDFVRPYNPEDEKLKETVKKPNSKKSTENKSGKVTGKKGKIEKTPTKLTLQMQGEICFTDPNLAIFRAENYKMEVKKFFVVLHVDNLMTRAQKIYLNPIVIKTMNLSHFPVERFENTGFTAVYCKYSIPCIAECKTIEKPISEFIRFNESHIYFTHTLSKIKLLEFLESKRLVLELYGIKRYHSKMTDPKLFGEKKSDSEISQIHRNFQKICKKQEEEMKTPDVLLAFCSYDLSSLLRNVWDFREKAQLHNVENSTFMRFVKEATLEPSDMDANCEFWSSYHMSTNNINLSHIMNTFRSDSTSPLKEWILLNSNTYLSLEAYLLSPQAAALVLHQIPNTYKRLFMIAFDRNVATEFFTNILQHNQKILCKKLNNEDMLTGWVLDNGNNIAIYVEGLAIGNILNLWQSLDNYPVHIVKIFFNTDHAYEKRLYHICNKWSGFYITTLKVPLDYIFKDQRLYIKGNAPILCLKALIKLNLLFHSRTLKHMLQYELFPSIEEIVSLDLEFGVPYAWKVSEPSEQIMLASDYEEEDY